MAKFRLRPKATGDIDAIWKYTYRTWSFEQANRYVAQIYATCQRVADNPEQGKQYDGIADDLYGFRSWGHIVFYRITAPGEILVERILHGRMDLQSRIRE